MKSSSFRWLVLIICNVAAWSVLSFFSTSGAAPPSRQPFGNSVEQRQQIIRELAEIKALMKEQNSLLRTMAAKDSNNERRQR